MRPLPCKRLIHTVGPRYNDKYKTAAENALHNCYRNALRVMVENKLNTVAFSCAYTVNKGYPRKDAAHIAIRTVRRFLEHWGEDIDLVVAEQAAARGADPRPFGRFERVELERLAEHFRERPKRHDPEWE